MSMVTTFADFSPGEVSRITGIHPDTLRTWRKRGAVASRGGTRVRFTPFEVGAFMIQHYLTKSGMSPADSKALGDEYAPRVVFIALVDKQLCEVSGPAKVVKRLIRKAESYALASEITGFGGEYPAVLLTIPPNAKPAVHYELRNDELDGITVCYLLNLKALGAQMADRVGPHPLVQIVWSDDRVQRAPVVTARV